MIIAAALVTAAAALALGGCSPVTREGEEAPAQPPRPNVIVITTDDQAVSTLRRSTMPIALSTLAEEGTTFTRSFASTPLCCPSRANFLTGQYAHNNGVPANHPGYPALRGKRNTLPVWLRRAGYRTALVGKYLNGYLDVAERTEPAPGWNVWAASHSGPEYWGDRISLSGREVELGPRSYLTADLNRRAVRFVRSAAGQAPFFLWLAQPAPHSISDGAQPAGPVVDECRAEGPLPRPADWRRLRDARAPRPPSFDESDVSDKPEFVRRQPPIEAAVGREIDARYRCILASLREVDRGIAKLRDALRREGEWERTIVVLTSDHGFFHGEHRFEKGKYVPYEEAMRVPLLIRVPDAYLGDEPPVPKVAEPVANIDLAPTVLELTRARPCRAEGRCRTLDGRSLVPLIRGDGDWPRDRGLLFEGSGNSPCRYEAIRTDRHMYAEHYARNRIGRCAPSGERELYDLTVDPFQLRNLLAGAPAGQPDRVLRPLQERLEQLRRCQGIRGRDPVPRSGSNCE